jgi:hypothetical protein
MNNQNEIMMDLDLLSIQNILNETGLKTSLLEKSELIPLSTLGVEIDPDESNRKRSIYMSFIPIPEEVFDNIKLLQFHTEMPFHGFKNSQSGLESLFNFININSPIGTFGLNDDYKISLRYIHTLNKFDSLSEKGPALLKILKFLIFTMDTYSDPIELVANSMKESNEVINNLRKML